MVTAAQQRAAAEYLGQEYEVSQRRAGAVLGRARSTLRYTPRDRSADKPLIQAIRRLARKHLRWGYRRIHARLEKQGWTVNIKKVHRLWQELGLRRKVRRKPQNKLGPKPGTSANSCVKQPARFKNDVWTYDFIADRTSSGRALKWLTLVDEYTRECLALHVDYALTGADVRGVLARVLGRRGAPRPGSAVTTVRNLFARDVTLAGWRRAGGQNRCRWHLAVPGKTALSSRLIVDSGMSSCEMEEFESAPDAKEKGEWFRREYNSDPAFHSSLACTRRPRSSSDECESAVYLHGQPDKDKKSKSDP